MRADLKRLQRDSESASATHSAQLAATPKKKSRSAIAAAVAFAAVILIAAPILCFRSAPAGENLGSIAILPFTNQTGDPNLEYLSDGVPESVMNSLSQLQNVRVASRNSAFHYKGKDAPAATIGKDLNVRSILFGRMSQQNKTLTISAELVDTKDDHQIWGKQYTGSVNDAATIEQSLVTDISAKLQPNTSKNSPPPSNKRRSENSDAYQAYLKGRYVYTHATYRTAAQAVDFFNEAIKLDPNYAAAYAGIADTYCDLAFEVVLPPSSYFPKAKAAALKAVELGPDLADAHSALGTVLWGFDWDWSAAEREMRKGLELDPNSVLGHQRLGMFLVTIGRAEEGVAETRKAHDLDPLSSYSYEIWGYSLVLAGKFQEADPILQQGMTLEKDAPLLHTNLAWSYAFDHQYPEAIAEYAKLPDLNASADQLPYAGLGFVYAVAGKRQKALQILAEFDELSKTRYIDSYLKAMIYSGLNDKDNAFIQLNKSFEEHSASMPFTKSDPFLANLRSDPRFPALLTKIGLPLN